jgi:hypothetical protein
LVNVQPNQNASAITSVGGAATRETFSKTPRTVTGLSEGK